MSTTYDAFSRCARNLRSLRFGKNVNIINVQVKAATIKSPIDGIVASRNINEGELATAGAQLMTVIEQGSVKLKGEVPQGALPLLAMGQSVAVGVDIYPNRTFTGSISLIAPMAVTTGEYFPIEITVPATDDLKPGMSAAITIHMVDDSVNEGDETVIVDLDAPTNATLASPSTYTLTIKLPAFPNRDKIS
jgi:multidrug efflux pump subunit AcrA (membrane-fusion protein)